MWDFPHRGKKIQRSWLTSADQLDEIARQVEGAAVDLWRVVAGLEGGLAGAGQGWKSQPCHGQRSQPFSIEPSPRGPAWCGQRLSSAAYVPSWRVMQTVILWQVTGLTRP